MLSSAITYDNAEPLLFPPAEHEAFHNAFPFTKKHAALLDTLQGLDTVGMMRALNSIPSTRTLACRDTSMLFQAH